MGSGSKALRAVAAVAALSPILLAAGAHRPAGADRSAAREAVAIGFTSKVSLARALDLGPATVLRTLPALRVAEVAPRGDVDAFARAAVRLPGIRYAEPVVQRRSADEPGLAPSPTGTPLEWQYAATHADAVPSAVQRAAAAITIAIVDTGADLTAPDIAAKAPLTYSAITGGSAVDDAWGHGTFVASLAAGSTTNGDGIAGFGGDAHLLIVQANRASESFTDLDEATGIIWAVDHGAQIVNLSIGGDSTSRTERDAIDYAVDHGVLVVAAAGNEYRRGNPVEYPAALLQPPDSNGIGGRGLAVGASTAKGERAAFSSSGGYVSLVAPGVNVLGAVASASSPADYPRLPLPGALGGLYGLGSGTSYAAPEVAGAAALVWAAGPTLSAQDVARILKETASNHGSWNPDTGWGVLDVAAAVARAGGGASPLASARVQLSGRRIGLKVSLSWTASAASAYRLSVAEDARPPRALLTGPSTAARYSLTPGHAYVFTVDAVDPTGAVVATSAPLRFAVAKRTTRQR